MSRFIAAVLDIVRGGIHPRQVALAVFCGILAGFLTGWNLMFLAVLVLVLLMNVPTKVFCEVFSVAMAVGWILTPASNMLGHAMLESTPLGGMLAPVADHPLIALCDLDRFSMLGGCLLALLLAVPAAWGAAQATTHLQTHYFLLREAAAGKGTWQTSGWVRFACWSIFGSFHQEPQPVETRLWRPAGAALLVGVVLPCLTVGWWSLPRFVERGLVASLCELNQAEVNAGSVRVSLDTGLLEIHDLQVADPKQLDRDRLRVGVVTAQLRPGPLLRGRMHIDRLLLEDIRGDVARQRRAQPYGSLISSIEGLAHGEHDWNQPQHGPESALKLEELLGNWEQFHGRINRLRDVIEKIESLVEQLPQAPGAEPENASAPGLIALREERCSFGQPKPRLWIEHLGAKGMSKEWGLGGNGSVEITNISSDPGLTGQPTKLGIVAPEFATELFAQLNLHQPNGKHELRFEAREIDLAELLQMQPSRSPLAIHGGALALRGAGWGNSQEFELTLRLDARNLEAQVISERKLAGLPPEIWNHGLRQLGSFQTDAVLYGAWHSPRLKIDADRLVSQYKSQLLAAGEHLLVAAIDDQIAKNEAILQRVIDKQFAKADQAMQRAAERVEQSVEAAASRVEQTADRLNNQAESLLSQGQQQTDQAATRVEAVANQGQAQIEQAQQQTEATLGRVEGMMTQGESRMAEIQRRFGGPMSAAAAVGASANPPSQATDNLAGQPMPQQIPPSEAAPGVPEPGEATVNPYELPRREDIVSRARSGLIDEVQRVTNEHTNASVQPIPSPPARIEPAADTAALPVTGYPETSSTEYPRTGIDRAAINTVAGVPTSGEFPAGRPTAEFGQVPASKASDKESAPRRGLPPAIGMELGYEQRRSPTTGPIVPGPVTQKQPLAGTAPSERRSPPPPYQPSFPNQPNSPYAPPPASDSTGESRIGKWTRGVTGKVKGMVPWGKDELEDEGAVATASDEEPVVTAGRPPGQTPSGIGNQPGTAIRPNVPRDSSARGPSGVISANPATPQQEPQKWYRFWR